MYFFYKIIDKCKLSDNANEQSTDNFSFYIVHFLFTKKIKFLSYKFFNNVFCF